MGEYLVTEIPNDVRLLGVLKIKSFILKAYLWIINIINSISIRMNVVFSVFQLVVTLFYTKSYA